MHNIQYLIFNIQYSIFDIQSLFLPINKINNLIYVIYRVEGSNDDTYYFA